MISVVYHASKILQHLLTVVGAPIQLLHFGESGMPDHHVIKK